MLIQENLYQWGKINMDKLIAKEVEFNGDILKAAQDPDGNIWTFTSEMFEKRDLSMLITRRQECIK